MSISSRFIINPVEERPKIYCQDCRFFRGQKPDVESDPTEFLCYPGETECEEVFFHWYSKKPIGQDVESPKKCASFNADNDCKLFEKKKTLLGKTKKEKG